MNAKPSTSSPIIRVRGSRHACQRAERRARLCSGVARPRGEEPPHRHRDHHRQHQHDRPRPAPASGTPAAAAGGADPRAGDRAEAERGVQPGHERAAEPALDVGALDVHRDVPDAAAEPDEHQPDRGRATGAGDQAGAEQRQPDDDGQRRRPAPPAPARAGARAARTAAARRPRRRRGRAAAGRAAPGRAPSAVADGRGARDERRERQPVGRERDDHGGARAGRIRAGSSRSRWSVSIGSLASGIDSNRST